MLDHIQPTQTPKINESRGGVSVLEIVFVGQCEVFVFVLSIFFSLAVKLIVLQMGLSILLKNVDFSDTPPFKQLRSNSINNIIIFLSLQNINDLVCCLQNLHRLY